MYAFGRGGWCAHTLLPSKQQPLRRGRHATGTGVVWAAGVWEGCMEGAPGERLLFTPHFKVQRAPSSSGPRLFCRALLSPSGVLHASSSTAVLLQQTCRCPSNSFHCSFSVIPVAVNPVAVAVAPAAADNTCTGLRRSLRMLTPTCCPWCWATVRRSQSPRGSWQSGRGRRVT